jgi:hypothetical protein
MDVPVWLDLGQHFCVSPLRLAINNFQKFLEMLDGAQTVRDEAGNLVSS